MVGDCFSDWTPVTSGILKGSILGNLLFVISINTLDMQVGVRIITFIDGIEIGDIPDCEEGYS